MNRKWLLGLMSGTVLLGLHVNAGAHRTVGIPSSACSPHDRTGSVGGSGFSQCFAVSEDFWRIFNCASGTACANDLCGGSDQACGASYSNGTTSHGKNGGHKATIDNFDCAPYYGTCVGQF